MLYVEQAPFEYLFLHNNCYKCTLGAVPPQSISFVCGKFTDVDSAEVSAAMCSSWHKTLVSGIL